MEQRIGFEHGGSSHPAAGNINRRRRLQPLGRPSDIRGSHRGLATGPRYGRARFACLIALVVLPFYPAPAAGQTPTQSARSHPDAGSVHGASAPAALDNPLAIPDLGGILPAASDAQGVTATLRILVLLTVLTLIPSILIMMTAFPRIIIVLALLRQAVGVPQLPPGQVLLALSLFITILVMTPVFGRIQTQALSPYLQGRLPQADAFDITAAHLKDFMYRQIETAGNHEDVFLFLQYAENRRIEPDERIDLDAVPLTVMVPAFMLSELKTAFLMGFRIYLPFLVIDMVIAAILLSMGMLMLPPVLISLPFKLLLFVLADGWHLVVETLLYSFG